MTFPLVPPRPFGIAWIITHRLTTTSRNPAAKPNASTSRGRRSSPRTNRGRWLRRRSVMGKAKFPSVKIAVLLRILERHCGPPVRTSGSHHFFRRSDGRRIMIAFHPKEMWGIHVRSLLITDLGLTEEEALREVGSQ